MEHKTLQQRSTEAEMKLEDDFLKAYYTSREPTLSPGVRLAPLAQFDKDFDLPYESSRHKVHLFKEESYIQGRSFVTDGVGD